MYLGLIVASTLASGQHYLTDLVLAVPYAGGVYRLARVNGFAEQAEAAVVVAS